MTTANMKKYLAIVSLGLLLSACQDYWQTPQEKFVGKAMMLPSGPYYIKNENGYQIAKDQCNNLAMWHNRTNDECMNELRWQREYGELKFLGPEKLKPIYQQ